jgi:molybdopterin-guanine dinucleotide biosynthesis protein A
MGQDKALLAKDGVPLIRRTWEVAHALTPDVWIVTPRRDRYAPLLPPSAQWIPEAPPPPEAPPAGPLVAFAHALHHIKADWVLLLACDLPNLEAAVLAQWQQDLAHLPETAIAYLPHPPEGWDPLCGFYRTACLPSLQAYVTTGKRSFQGWLSRASVVPITHVPVAMLANCNTPQDWDQLQKD